MATQISQLKGTAAVLNTKTFNNGVVVVDETNKSLRVHDGATLGGTLLAKAQSANGATIIFEGDSITHHLNADIVANGFAYLFSNMSWASSKKAFYNFAQGGNQVSDLAGRYASLVYPHRPTVNGGDGGPKSYLFILIGTNDFNFYQNSWATYQTALQNYINTAKADGFTVVLSTILPTTGEFATGTRLRWETANQYIRSNGFGVAYVVDYASILRNANDLTMFADGLHPNNAGHMLLALYLNAYMTANGLPVSNYDNDITASQWKVLAVRTLVNQGVYHPNLGDYDELHISGLLYPQTNLSKISMNFSGTGGVTVQNLAYQKTKTVSTTATPTAGTVSDGVMPIADDVGSNINFACDFDVYIKNWRAATYTNVTFRSSYGAASGRPKIDATYQVQQNLSMDTFRILEVLNGTYTVRGLRY